MKILGIDPGSHRCGWAVIDGEQLVDHGCFDYPKKSEVAARLVALEGDINQLISRFSPDCIAVESLFFNTNVTTAMHVAEARGVVLLAAGKRQIPTTDVTPLQVKMAITGYGRADKAQIKKMIELQFKNHNLHRLDDAVDAIAVAVTGKTLTANAVFLKVEP